MSRRPEKRTARRSNAGSPAPRMGHRSRTHLESVACSRTEWPLHTNELQPLALCHATDGRETIRKGKWTPVTAEEQMATTRLAERRRLQRARWAV